MPTRRVPLVLQQHLRSIPASTPEAGTYYCAARQLWIRSDGRPVVTAHGRASDFGETSATATREGIDQTEASGELAQAATGSSDFGETTITETREGTDQAEGASLLGSDFGETTLTRTSEGVDQTESMSASDFGETTKTATAEGMDQSEALNSPAEEPW